MKCSRVDHPHNPVHCLSFSHHLIQCIVIGPRGVLGLSLVPDVSLDYHLSPRCPWSVVGPQSVLGLSFVPKVSLVCHLSPRCPWTIICPRGDPGVLFAPKVSLDYCLSPRCPWTIIYPQRVLGLSFIPPQGVPEAAADGRVRVQEMQEEHDVPAQAGISTTAQCWPSFQKGHMLLCLFHSLF